MTVGLAAISAVTFGSTIAVAGSASASLAPTHAIRAAEPWANAKTVGFIMVGEETDEGYNQAVYTASLKVKKDLGVTTLLADNVPETQQVTTVMQQMVDQGAKIIFATSYGYQSYAYAFAKSHPSVLVLHQGGTYAGKKFPANLGTYFGEAYDPVSLGGIAAGAATKTNKLGFVYAFPIPQTVDNVDAFELGALSVNPKAKTYTVATSEWCDPLKQKSAAAALLSEGADVLSQHQDCQSTVIQAAKAGGAKVVGYHYDAESLDPAGWLTGSVWAWAPLYESIIKTAKAGKFTGSQYNANFIGTFKSGNNPLTLAPFGASVTSATKAKIVAEEAKLKSGASIFKGPISCNNGKVLVPAGKTATPAQVNQFTCFVKGVVASS
ncbi:MAG TPA: BMP family ABC transporter substrate-binding protein [Acidimicrobiales bacterium]|jgi:simple sugar transport system substrate-binding protein/basic membrane protein A|nr:BMP family ABC transporter substrate-binding protein [Acidimicrobiales bacterium]